ncbi:MAG: hypothetical protein E7162_02980 [Firmicutes bacterium]|nr:hypothetical protein [Bacillota bacterium]
MEEKNIENEQLEQKDIPENNVKLTVLLIVISILLIVGCICLGFYLGKSSNEDENKNQVEEKEEVNNIEDKKEENLTIIDKNEAPNPTIVKVEKNKVVISNKKPDYYEEEDLPYYKDGYVGYYSDNVIGHNNTSGIMFIDEPKYEFVPLYKCKNPEFGKCGYAETLGANSDYNLEEGIKNSLEGLVYLDNRYIFVYDSNYYLEAPYINYFSKDVPLIVYDTKTNKELGKYSGIYYSYGDSASSLIAVDLEGNYGVVSIKDGEINNIVEFKYDYIGSLYNQTGLMLVEDGQYYVYYPHTNSKVGPFNNQIASYSDKYIITNEGSYLEDSETNYRLYDITGKKILVDAGYKYMEIIDQFKEEYIIVVNENGDINIIDQDGKEVLDKWITGAYGLYHIRCCAAVMAYHYDVHGSIMELYITKEGKTEEELNIYKYTIDLVTKTYEVELSDDYY